jgi:multimeric flavodoxin WrbA
MEHKSSLFSNGRILLNFCPISASIKQSELAKRTLSLSPKGHKKRSFERMNILGISGSLREDGNTAYSVQYALDVLKKDGVNTQYISLANKDVHPCIGCWNCMDAGECIYEDDMDEIMDAMAWCHGLIIGSPVYMGLVNGQLKTMMDRSVPLRVNRQKPFQMDGKVGGGIACGGFRNGGMELTLQCIHTFLLQQNMMAVSDGVSYSHSGAAVVGNAKEDELGLKTVTNLARNMARMIDRLKI